MSATRLAVVVVAVVSAAVAAAGLIGRAEIDQRQRPAGSPPVFTGALGPSTAVTPPQALRLGRLRLQPCEIGGRGADGLATVNAYCTALAVPENWQAPSGRQISLKVAVVKAEGAQADADVVTFLDGGPGGAATEDYPAIAPALQPLRERHHLLLIDQRGTGGSNALNCPQLQDATAAAAPEDPQGPRQASAELARAQQPEALAQQLRQCLAALSPRAAPQYYTTTDAIRDLEAVRQALGAPLLDLIGTSYGTRVAQQYASHYPGAVRSVVLDSPVPNSLALLSEHARNLEHALQALFAHCTADAACAQRFADPYGTLYRLRARLKAQPQTVDLRDPVSFEPLQLTMTADDLAAVVRFYAYSPLTAALLPLMLQEADRGNYAPLLGQKKWLADDLSDQITSGMELSVVCAEDADLLFVRSADEDTLLGNGAIARAQAACRIWPKRQRPADFHSAWFSSLPVLILSGELDPVTPPVYGMQILRGLSHGRLLVARGQGHGVLSAGCMPRLVQRFIDTADAAALDAGCLKLLGDIPAFIDYNGAAP